MVAAQPEEPYPMTEADYLAFEAESEFKHEFSRGYVYAMTGASVRHGIIGHLNTQLSHRNCTVTSSDVRVHIARKNTFRYPDVTVFCGDPAYAAGRTDTLTNPVVVVEVLSPNTALTDCNEKLMEYTQVETLHTYLLVAQDEARIECYRRHETGEWLYNIVTGEAGEIALPAIDCTLFRNLLGLYAISNIKLALQS